MNQMTNQVPYKQCHERFDAMIEPLTNMDLIMAQAAVKDSTEESDIQFYRAIHWELKLRSERKASHD